MKLAGLSINQVNAGLSRGTISKEDAAEYVRSWNAGPVFTQAVLFGNEIRNFDPDSGAYRHLWEQFNVRA